MKLFSMDWFRSTKKEMEETKKSIENLEEHVGTLTSSVTELGKLLGEAVSTIVDNALETEKLFTKQFEDVEEELDSLRKSSRAPLIKNLKLVGDVMILTTQDGNVITKSNATREDFEKVKAATSKEEIDETFATKVEYKTDPSGKINVGEQDFRKILSHKDFTKRDGSVFMKDVPNRSIPDLLVKKFSECIGTIEYDRMKKFWLKCCLNPNAQSAEDLYAFLKTHNMKIDRHGNFYAYRRVVSISKSVSDKKYVDFISNTYNKVKAVWKKKPSNFDVYVDENVEYKFTDKVLSHDNLNSCLGNLEQLYLNLPLAVENRYTDAHTHQMDYRVGEIASIPRHECDDNNNVNCSKGLHAASKQYNYSGFGDTPILMIINPADVIAAPLNETAKLRVCRFFFAMTLDENEKYILDEDDFDVTDLGDVFEEKYLENAHDFVMSNFAEEVKRHTFNIPNINTKEIENTLEVLNSMYNTIKNRVKTL